MFMKPISRMFYIINKNDKKLTIRRIITEKISKKENKEYTSFSITIPKPILDAIGITDKIYFYYYKDEIYLTSTRPEGKIISQEVKPHITVSKTSKNYENALKYAQRTVSLPQLFYDTYHNKYCELTMYTKPDYINPEYPLLKIEAKPLNTDEIYLEKEATTWILEQFKKTK